MVSDKILVSDRGEACDGLDAALTMVEKSADYANFDAEQVQKLRYMAEEMVVGSASMLDIFTGTMWTQTEDGMFQIILEMKGTFTQVERDRLVALTRDNKNTPPEGFFAKLGALLSDAFTGEYYIPYTTGDLQGDPTFLWSGPEVSEMMADMNRQSPQDAALGDVAKVVLDTYADDIIVSANGSEVTVTVSKALPDKAKEA